METKNAKNSRRRRHNREGKASVLLMVGGTFQELTRFEEAAGADLALYADVANEIEATNPHKGVVTVTLAAGETLGTLADEDCPEGIRKYLNERPGAILNDGLGQLPGVGDLAARKLLSDPAFESFLTTEVFERLLKIHNGCIEEARLVVASSIAGGTGGPVGPALAKAIAAMLLKCTDAAVEVQFFRIGSLSFVGLGDRVHINSAAALAHDVDYVLSSDRDPREVRTLIVCEGPMVGARKHERDQFVIELSEAVSAQDLRELLKRVGPNRALALNNRLGNITIMNAAWWHKIADRRIAAEVASAYIPPLERIARTGSDPESLKAVHVDVEQGSTRAALMDDLVDEVRKSKRAKPADFEKHCTEPTLRYSARVRAQMRDGRALDLRDPRVTFSKPCRTVCEFSQRLCTLRTIASALDQQRVGRVATLKSLGTQEKAARVDLAKVIRRLFPKGGWQRVKAMFADPDALLVAFKSGVTRVREIVNQRRRLEVEVEAIDQAASQVGVVIQDERQRLQSVIRALAPYLPTQELLPTERLVEVVDLDSALDGLLGAIPGGPEVVLRTLGSCACRVTLAGLAKITNADEPKADAIARSLSNGEAASRAPVWGGRRPVLSGDETIVLPPLGDDHEKEMRNVLADVNRDAYVAYSDTAQGGVNALKIDIHKPENLNQIFTPFIREALLKALEEPAIFFPNGTDCVERLGLMPRAEVA